jgi:hypothetical protein
VELTRERVASPELAARLPSAALGALAVGIVAAGTYALAGPTAAVGATLLFAVYPEAIVQSRTGRFYMLQLVPGLIALFAGWVVVRRSTLAISGRDRWFVWLAAGVTCVTLLQASRIQVTTALTVFAWWLVLAGVGVRDLKNAGRRAWRSSIPLQLATTMAVAGLATVVAAPWTIASLIVRAISTPYWARVVEQSPLLYYHGLTVGYPLLAVVGIASLALLLLRRPRLAVYLGLMCLVPALALSFVLPFKAGRFLLLAVPPLFVAVGIAVADSARALGDRLSRPNREQPGRLERTPLATFASCLILALPLITSMPAVYAALIGYDRIATRPDWKAAAAILRERQDLAGVPLGATRSLPAQFYWGRVDFSVSIGHLERWNPDLPAALGAAERLAGAYAMNPVGTQDIYAGVPVLPTPSSIAERFAGPGRVVIAIDETSIRNGMVDPDLVARLTSESEELCQRRCGALRLFVWRLERSAVHDATVMALSARQSGAAGCVAAADPPCDHPAPSLSGEPSATAPAAAGPEVGRDGNR